MEIQLKEAVLLILSETGNTVFDKIPCRKSITYYDFYTSIIKNETAEKVYKDLGLVSSISVEKIIYRYIKILFPNKPKGVKWSSYLLSLIQYKKCSSCSKILPIIPNFVKAKDNWDGYSYICKACKAVLREDYTLCNPEYNKQTYQQNKSEYIARAIQYRTKRNLATPSWADLDKIKAIYNECPKGYHVDHIIPLQGALVCGLHVETNLQYLTAQDNIIKHNKFEII